MGEHAKFKQNGTSMFEPWTIWPDWANPDNSRYDYLEKKQKNKHPANGYQPSAYTSLWMMAKMVVKPKYDAILVIITIKRKQNLGLPVAGTAKKQYE